MQSMRRTYADSPSSSLQIRCFYCLAVCPPQIPTILQMQHCTAKDKPSNMLIKASNSIGNHKPLPLVPPLQRPTTHLLILLIPLLPRRKHPLLHRNRILLRPVRLARSLCALRLAIRRRKRTSLHGLGIRNGRGLELSLRGQGAGCIWQRDCGWWWIRGEEEGKEWDECGDGEGGCYGG